MTASCTPTSTQKGDSMKTSALFVLGAIASLLLANSVYATDGRPVGYSAAGGCTFTNTSITFDGVNDASISTCMESDSFGLATGQVIGAYYDSGLSCTAPDGTAGETYTLEFATGASIYTAFNDQLFSYSETGTLCTSLTTGVGGGKTTFTVSGGTGRFKGATGSFASSFTSSYLYSAGAGQTGYFGRDTYSNAGTITR
jgi:hypothetical protein